MSASQMCPGCRAELSASALSDSYLLCAQCQGTFVSQVAPTIELLTRQPDGLVAPARTVTLPEGFRKRFELGCVLGSGAMGMAIEAQDRQSGRRVAIKILLSLSSGEVVKRFLREGELLRRIRHANVIELHELSMIDGLPFLVAELLEGGTLRQRLPRPERMPLQAAAPIVLQVLAGLEACHGHAVVHRDLKPENVLFTRDGVAKIADLGIAKAFGEDTSMTRTGAVIGTPKYMSPEQALGNEVTIAADLYAAGLIFFEMLAGHPPFVRTTVMELLRAHVEEAPPLLAKLVPGLPAPVEALIHAALAKRPADRPASAAEFAQRLRRALAPPSVARRASRPAEVVSPPAASPSRSVPALSPPPARTSVLVTAAGATLVLALGLVIGTLRGPEATQPGTSSSRARITASPEPRAPPRRWVSPSPALTPSPRPAPSTAASTKPVQLARLPRPTPRPPPSPAPVPRATPRPSPLQPPPRGSPEEKWLTKGRQLVDEAEIAFEMQDGNCTLKAARAVTFLEKALAAGFQRPEMQQLMGIALCLRGADRDDYAKARKTLSKALPMDPEKRGYLYLAGACSVLERDEEAIESFQLALELDPDWAETHYRIALFYDQSLRREAAARVLEHATAAIRLKPTNRERFEKHASQLGAVEHVPSQIARFLKGLK